MGHDCGGCDATFGYEKLGTALYRESLERQVVVADMGFRIWQNGRQIPYTEGRCTPDAGARRDGIGTLEKCADCRK
ncbi:MAG: hypothetical protein ACLT46_07145 [Hungatella sp.]